MSSAAPPFLARTVLSEAAVEQRARTGVVFPDRVSQRRQTRPHENQNVFSF